MVAYQLEPRAAQQFVLTARRLFVDPDGGMYIRDMISRALATMNLRRHWGSIDLARGGVQIVEARYH